MEYGKDFYGMTAEEQAASIAECLTKDPRFAEIAENFEITSKGESVILTSKNEGNKELTITAVDVEDEQTIRLSQRIRSPRLLFPRGSLRRLRTRRSKIIIPLISTGMR